MIEGTVGYRIVYYSKMFVQWVIESLRAKKASVEIEECRNDIGAIQVELTAIQKKLSKYRKRLVELELLNTVPRSYSPRVLHHTE